MAAITYRGRKAFQMENDTLRVVLLLEGGHVAQILHKHTGVSPLWTPPWPSMEPSHFSPAALAIYGSSAEAIILASIMGHSICLDTYGAPSAEEAAAGMPIHGEGPLVAYRLEAASEHSAVLSTTLPLAQIEFTRTVTLQAETIAFTERVRNLAAFDRTIAWTQHVSLGPPFLAHGETEFRLSAARSSVIDADFGGRQKRAAEFTWPYCPMNDGSQEDLRRFTTATGSAGFTTHLAERARSQAFFTSWSPQSRLAFGYIWRRTDFPWICRWEENRTRKDAPWNGETITCAFEFGVSPTIESRREMVTRGALFGEPAFRWLPALGTLEVEYWAFATQRDAIPEQAHWDARTGLTI